MKRGLFAVLMFWLAFAVFVVVPFALGEEAAMFLMTSFGAAVIVVALSNVVYQIFKSDDGHEPKLKDWSERDL